VHSNGSIADGANKLVIADPSAALRELVPIFGPIITCVQKAMISKATV